MYSPVHDLVEASAKLSKGERRFLSEEDAEIHVSAGSICEMSLKYRARHPWAFTA